MKFIIFFCVFYIFDLTASPWIINENHHRYILASNIIDKNSHNLQKIRSNKILANKKHLEYLSKLLKDNQLSNIHKKNIKFKINILEKRIEEMESYHNNHFKKFIYEYGMNNRSNIGFGIFYTENRINNINFHASIFSLIYKYQLFQKNNFTISLIYEGFLENNLYQNIKYLHKNSFAIGKITENKWGKFIFSNILACKYDLYGYYEYHLMNSQSIKFKNNIMLTNFNKYSYIPNNNIIHNRILYQELSISKEIDWKNSLINLSIGYFWNKSLVNSKHQTSGIIIASIWDF